MSTMTSNVLTRLMVVLNMYVNGVVKHPLNLNYSTEHVYIANGRSPYYM